MYYKVLRKHNDQLVSYSDVNPLDYKVGVWTRADIGKLMCFNTLHNAKRLVKTESNLVFECDVENPNIDGPFFHYSVFFGWSTQDKPDILRYLLRTQRDSDIPLPGTVFCDAIKPIRLVYGG